MRNSSSPTSPALLSKATRPPLDALVSFEASLYSVPWTDVRPRQRLELRVTREDVEIWSLGPEARLLATHRRATRKGSRVVDERHWDGLPDGTSSGLGSATATHEEVRREVLSPLTGRAPAIEVARRSPAAYDALFAIEVRP